VHNTRNASRVRHRRHTIGRLGAAAGMTGAGARHHGAVEWVLFVLAMLMQPLALGVVLTPPIALTTCRRRIIPTVLLYLVALGLLVAWFSAWNANLDWADRTGGQGNIFAGAGWFLGAVAAAVGATALTIGRRRRSSLP
jgi:hypothetical protein